MTSMRVGGVRVSPRGWVLIGVVAVAIVAVAVAVFAVERASGDSPPSERTEASHEPFTVRVGSVSSGVAETSVEIVVDGRPDLGANVVADRIAILTDSAGTRHFQSGGMHAGRSVTLRFPGAASMQPGHATLEISGLWLTDDDVRQGTAPVDSRPETTISVELPLDVPAPSGASLHTPVGSSGPLGPGTATVDSVSRDASTFLVSGTVSGFTRDQIQAMSLYAVLVLEDGTRLSLTGGRAGYGPDLGSFEFKFDLPSASTVATHIELSLAEGRIPGPLREDRNPEVQAALDEIEQAQGATLLVRLPR